MKEQVSWWLFGPSIYIFSVGSETAIFVPRGKRSDWIFINVFFFFLLIYRKRKFCAEPMRERLTFDFELRTRSVNFRFFFFFSFFLFFQIKARSRLVTFCWYFRLKRNERRKKDRDTFKLNFYSQVNNYFVAGECFSWTSKNSNAFGRSLNLRKSFFLAPGSPSFQAWVDCPSRHSPPRRF